MKRSELLCKLALNDEVLQVVSTSQVTSKLMTKNKVKSDERSHTGSTCEIVRLGVPGTASSLLDNGSRSNCDQVSLRQTKNTPRPTCFDYVPGLKEIKLGKLDVEPAHSGLVLTEIASKSENVSTDFKDRSNSDLISLVQPKSVSTCLDDRPSPRSNCDQISLGQPKNTPRPTGLDYMPSLKKIKIGKLDVAPTINNNELVLPEIEQNMGRNKSPVFMELKDLITDSDSSFEMYDSDNDPEYFPEEPIRKPTGIDKILLSKNCQAKRFRPIESAPNTNTSNVVNNVIEIDVVSRSTLSETGDEPIKNCENREVQVKKVSRWKKSNPDQWKINKNKAKRMSGLPYKSKHGKEMKPKQPKLVDCSKCFYKCSNNFSEDDRKSICAEYTGANYDKQRDLIISLVDQENVTRKRKVSGDGKQEKAFSYSYNFVKDNKKVRVCKNFFLKTLSISNGPLKTAFAFKSNYTGTFIGEDKRGRKVPPNKTNEDWIQKIKLHIESFPTMESHYCRKDTKKKYLDPSLSIAKMYELFETQYKDQENLPKKNVYREIFCTNYNMSFFSPSKDRCLRCINFEKANGEEKKKIEKLYNEHIERKEAANKSKQEDKERATADKSFVSMSFDLQKVLQIPISNAGPVYYSRKLCVYNLTMYESAPPNKAYCFSWTENNGKRGSCEIGSCLLKWFETLPGSVKEVSLYSDTCGGQNRNQYIASLFLFISETLHFDVLEHKFLESGHSKMEADSMHSAIEFAQRNVPVFCMRDWLTVFAMARSNRNNKKGQLPKAGYVVQELKFEDFKDLKSLSHAMIKNRTTDSNKQTVQWLKIKRLRYEKQRPGVILFSYNYTGDYQTLQAHDILPGRPKKPCPLKNLYKSELSISEAKKKDLLKLCKTGVIPKDQHWWFEALKSTKSNSRSEPTPEPTTEEYFNEEVLEAFFE